MSAKRKKIKEHQLNGFKYFKAISEILEELHDAGCQRDLAGNRKLHMDQYISLILLFMFNPICSSLRALQQASELKKVQRILGVPRASLGSLSEAARVFDSELMEQVVEKLAAKLGPVSKNSKLSDLDGIITLVDGSLINTLSKMTWACWKSDQNAVRIHTQFDLQKYVPIKMTVTEGRGKGKSNEKEVLADNLEPGRIYVKDRGYASLALFQQILDQNSSFVCRIRDDSKYDILKEHELTQDALNAGIVFDREVRLGGDAKTQSKLSVPVRMVAIKCEPRKKRYNSDFNGPEQGETILVVTNKVDLDADVIGLIFQNRWAIEIFFRFFKHILGCRHLLSHCQNGIELQTYAAIIACMLISLWTGRKPTLRTYEMLCWYFTGMADFEELTNHIARLQKYD
ncbi:MAG: IS4 family transposase [Thermodesulfovibrionales bacterium]|nr:IS4 family transposase [Thermodesulfovibrionales bacterium]